MFESWLLRVYDDRLLSAVKECAPPMELGRQDDRAAEGLYQVSHFADGHVRVAIARSDEVKLSRRLAWLEEVAGGMVLVRNISSKVTFSLDEGRQVAPGGQCEVELPVVLQFGKRVVRIQKTAHDPGGSVIQSLDRPTAFPSAIADDRSILATLALPAVAMPDADGLIEWLRVMIRVFQSAACDADFFHQAASAVVEVVRLDSGRVLIRERGEWKTVASCDKSSAPAGRREPPSRMVVNRVCDEKRVTWLDPSQLGEDCASLSGVSSVVASPVLDRAGQVIAILYGERRLESMLQAVRPVSKLDAMLVEVLAVGLSAGLARVKEERAALALQTQLEQFFTPELARQLMARPELLTGQDLEITVLFCDIRSFSRITREHQPAFTLEWTNDVLSTLSDCVLKHQGVLVNYIGDELMAMWGAPEAQPDHPARACRAALEMLESLEALNDRWQGPLGEPIGLGIGVNTGMARVGNTGSQRKFQYGPLGTMVNVASRTQGACKYFKSSLLITKETRDRLGQEFPVRRLGKARVVNMTDPIELYELWPPGESGSEDVCPAYEEALATFEAGDFQKSALTLRRILDSHPEDGPSNALLARATAYIVVAPETLDSAFRLPGK
ncbi:MAG: adenylate/guanylate cyclase domain-containing protein [Isosphaeraceae bacterium]